MVREIGSVVTMEGRTIAVAANGPKVVIVGATGAGTLTFQAAAALAKYITQASEIAERE